MPASTQCQSPKQTQTVLIKKAEEAAVKYQSFLKLFLQKLTCIKSRMCFFEKLDENYLRTCIF